MARRPRIDIPGYHHIINRGVNKTDIFKVSEDKETFLKIACKACSIYHATLHDYCLMDNHYHLLIENQQDNLSLLMRQINANYAIYFNKKYLRSGHLWQGRYSSWYIIDDEYLYRTIRYIEHNPIKAKITAEIREYPYTLGSLLLRGEEVPTCAMDSMMISQFDTKTLANFLDEALGDDEIKMLETERKKQIEIKDRQAYRKEKKALESYFDSSMTREHRNSAIYEAYRDGHTQKSIAKYIGLTDAAVNIIIKKFRI